MLLNKTKRDFVVSDATHRMMKMYDELDHPDRGPLSHYCLFWAISTARALRAIGLPAQLQAGSAFWTSVREEDDDGRGDNQYGYLFELNQKSVSELAQGLLPEMHVWTAIIKGEERELVDLTAPFFKDRCIALGGRWTMPDPPPYFWSDLKSWPSGLCSYEPDMNATHIAYSILESMKTGRPAVFTLMKDR